jgi:methyltransferase family protein
MFDIKKPNFPLPIQKSPFDSAEAYVESLLEFATSSHQLQLLCGGIHILDFFTRSPDLYCSIIPNDWRAWFETVEIDEILDLLLRRELQDLTDENGNGPPDGVHTVDKKESQSWVHSSLPPPRSLINFVTKVRRHCLVTDYEALNIPDRPRKGKFENGVYTPSSHAMTAGMNAKKKHEVVNFARYVAGLADTIGDITHIVDFGSGANYLGRTLASEPYNRHVIAVESRPHVVLGAQKMDQRANVVKKTLVLRNKKKLVEAGGMKAIKEAIRNGEECDDCFQPATPENMVQKAHLEFLGSARGTVQYVQHQIENGDLSSVIDEIININESAQRPLQQQPSLGNVKETSNSSNSGKNASYYSNLMVTSLHSCGNLVHHGLRTLKFNPAVRAVAMVGCCYNLATERLNPPSYKLPSLKLNCSSASTEPQDADPHGFPMSDRFLNYRYKPLSTACCTMHDINDSSSNVEAIGIRLNITARMMGVQAPRNWTKSESEEFFVRHFYRALLQRIFLDRGIIEAPELCQAESSGRSPAGTGSEPTHGTRPIVIGGLPKACYSSFLSYVRGATSKLMRTAMKESPTLDPGVEQPSASNTPHPLASIIHERISTMSDEQIIAYETDNLIQKKNISIAWSLMAFSAQVVEALVIVDRWLWLKEQDYIGDAWVQPVFDYAISPRNMVIVGIRK